MPYLNQLQFNILNQLQSHVFEPGGRNRPGAGDDDQHGRGGRGQKVQATHRANYRGNFLMYLFSSSHSDEQCTRKIYTSVADGKCF
jgi:hypothetical protein